MRKETYMSTQKKEKERRIRRKLETLRKRPPHTPNKIFKKSQKVQTSSFVGSIFVQKQQGKLLVFSL